MLVFSTRWLHQLRSVPNSIEPSRPQLRVNHCVVDRPVAQVILDLAQISPFIGQHKPGRVPQHMRMNQWQATLLAYAAQHSPKAVCAHRHAALVIENELTTGWLFALELSKLSQLVAEDWMCRAG